MLVTAGAKSAPAPADAIDTVRAKLAEFGVATVKMLRDSTRSLRSPGGPEAALESLRAGGEVATADALRKGTTQGPTTPVYWLSDTPSEVVASSGFNVIGFPSSGSGRPDESRTPYEKRFVQPGPPRRT